MERYYLQIILTAKITCLPVVAVLFTGEIWSVPDAYVFGFIFSTLPLRRISGAPSAERKHRTPWYTCYWEISGCYLLNFFQYIKISLLPSSFFFLPVLWRYNWHTALCKFKMYSTMIWITYIMKWLPHKFSVRVFSHIRFFATPWTIACQAPLSMDSPGKNTGVGCHFLLQGIFPT